MNVIYLILTYILFNFNYSFSKEITLTLFKENGLFFIPLSIGSPLQKVKLIVDLLSNSTWVASSKCSWFYMYVADNTTMYLEDRSTSLLVSPVHKESRKEAYILKGEGSVSYDYFFLGSNSSEFNHSFILANYFISEIPSNGVLGLDKANSSVYTNSSSDGDVLPLLDSLYLNKMIDKKILSINTTNNIMTLGEYPSIPIGSLYNYSTCSNTNLTYDNTFIINQMDNVNSHWICKLSRVFTGDLTQLNAITLDKVMLFSSTITGMLISHDYLPYFERNFFYGFSVSSCLKSEYGNTFVYACHKSFNISILPVVNFEIDNWVYTFNPEKLFTENRTRDYYYETSTSPDTIINEKDYNFFKIRFVNRHKYNMNYSIIGIDMFDDTIVFDKEKDEIGFYTNNKIHKKDLIYPAPGMSLVILLVIIICSFFGFVISMVIGYVCYLHFFKGRERIYQVEMSRDIDEYEDGNQIKQI